MPGNPHRAARARGRRFELSVIQSLARAGFYARRVDESDGFSRGIDLTVWAHCPFLDGYRWLQLPVYIQCKATRQEMDIWRGLRECRNAPGQAFWRVCVHSWRREGKQPWIRAAWTEALGLVSKSNLLIWGEFLLWLCDRLPCRPEHHRAALTSTKFLITKGKVPPKFSYSHH